MKRALSITMVGYLLVTVPVVDRVALADPIGSANVAQIVLGTTGTPLPVSGRRTFLTTDTIELDALYYDPNPACAGVPPLFAQVFVFNLEGLFMGQVNAASAPAPVPASTKYRSISVALGAGAFGPGGYKFTFLVRSCDDMISIVLPELLTFRVVAP